MLVKLSESPVAEAHLVASSAMLALIGLLANLPVGNGGTAAPAIRALHNLLVRSEATAALACCLNCVPPLLRLIEHGNLVASHRAAAAWTAAGAAAAGGASPAAAAAAEAATAAAATLASSSRPGAAPLSEEAVWLLQVAAGEAAAALPPAAVEVVLSATGGGNARPTLLTLPTEAGLPPPPA